MPNRHTGAVMPNRHTGAGRQQATATQAPAGTRQPPHRRRQAAGSRHTGAGRQQAAATQAPAGTRQPPAENRRTYMYVIFDMDGVIVDSEAVYLGHENGHRPCHRSHG